jgi:hypothetical protein
VVEAFSAWLAPWDDYRVDLVELTDHGDVVLARTRHHMRGKASGIQVEKVIFQLWTLRNRRIVRVQMYYEEAEALAVATRVRQQPEAPAPPSDGAAPGPDSNG